MYQLCNDIIINGIISLQSPSVGDMSTQGMSAGKSTVPGLYLVIPPALCQGTQLCCLVPLISTGWDMHWSQIPSIVPNPCYEDNQVSPAANVNRCVLSLCLLVHFYINVWWTCMNMLKNFVIWWDFWEIFRDVSIEEVISWSMLSKKKI